MYVASGRAAAFVRRVLAGAGSGGDRRPAWGWSRWQSGVCGVRDMRPWLVAVGVHG